ncbi:MAG: PEP-CTERM sorting domain-containing protein, partial [Phycisphaerae bacterium]
LAGGSAMAELLVYEPFPIGESGYTAGNNLRQDIEWAEFGGCGDFVVSGSGLTYEKDGRHLQTSGGSVHPAADSMSSGSRVGCEATIGSELYVSFLVQMQDVDNGKAAVVLQYDVGGYQLVIEIDGGNACIIGTSNYPSDSQGNHIPHHTPFDSVGLESSTTHLVVFGLEQGSGKQTDTTFWLDPDLSNPDSPDDVGESYFFMKQYELNFFGIFAENGTTTGKGGVIIDEVRIGSTLSDVLPHAPEPGSMAMLAAGAVLLIRRRRRAA